MKEESVSGSGSSNSKDQRKAHAQPIKSTKIRRALVVAATEIARHASWLRIGWACLRLSPGLMVKCGPTIRLEEAYNFEYIRKNTSVPVPRVHCAFVRKGITYIVMDYVHGETLRSWWFHVSAKEKSDVLHQLRGHMNNLRDLKNPKPGQVGGLSGGPIYDFRYAAGRVGLDGKEHPDGEDAFGPFENAYDFHLWLRNGFKSPIVSAGDKPSEAEVALDKLCQIQDRRDYSTVITHGDFGGLNIIIKNNRVVAIIDWATAGWLPDYWEYTSAWHVNPYNGFWQPEVGKVLTGDEYAAELEAEQIRRQYFQSP